MVERWSSSQRKMLPMLAHYELPPLSTHKLCTNRTFVLGDGRVSLRGWFGARGRGAQAQGSGIQKFLLHASFPSHKLRQWSIADADCVHTQSLLKNCYKPGSSLSRAKAGNCTTALQTAILLILSLSLSLFLCCFSNPTWFNTLIYTKPHTL